MKTNAHLMDLIFESQIDWMYVWCITFQFKTFRFFPIFFFIFHFLLWDSAVQIIYFTNVFSFRRITFKDLWDTICIYIYYISILNPVCQWFIKCRTEFIQYLFERKTASEGNRNRNKKKEKEKEEVWSNMLSKNCLNVIIISVFLWHGYNVNCAQDYSELLKTIGLYYYSPYVNYSSIHFTLHLSILFEFFLFFYFSSFRQPRTRNSSE